MRAPCALMLFAFGCRAGGKGAAAGLDTGAEDDTGDVGGAAPPCPVFVATEGGAGAPGTEADPVPSITEALTVRAEDCLDVWVGPGTYTEDVDYGTAELRLLGVGGALATTLRGTGAGPVVSIAGGQLAAELVGFRITGGAGRPGDGEVLRAGETWGGGLAIIDAAAHLEDLVIDGNTATGGGGGVLLLRAAATVDEVVVADNRVDATGPADGGGIFMLEAALDATTLMVAGNTIVADGPARGGGISARAAELHATDLLIEDNALDGVSDDADDAEAWSGGGGLAVASTTLVLDATTLLGNAVSCSGTGADAVSGGGLHALQSTVDLRGATVLGNTAAGTGCVLRGGGLSLASVDGALDGVDLRDNGLSVTGGGSASGGGLSVLDASPSLSGLVVAGNHLQSEAATSAHLLGGGLWLDRTSPDLRRSTLHGNRITADDAGAPLLAGAGLYLTEAAPSLVGVLITGNAVDARGAAGATTGAGGVHGSATGAPAISFSDVWGNAGDATAEASAPAADGNLSVDPLYVDASADAPVLWDLSLPEGSPCVDAGDPDETDEDGTRADMGAP